MVTVEQSTKKPLTTESIQCSRCGLTLQLRGRPGAHLRETLQLRAKNAGWIERWIGFGFVQIASTLCPECH